MGSEILEATYLMNYEAEQAAIGAMIVEPELIGECWLKPEHFGDKRHNNLFYVFRDLEQKGKPVDLVSIVERVGKAKVDKIGGVGYITELAGSIASTANFNYYQGVIYDYYQKRMAYKVAKNMMNDVIESEPGKLIQSGIDELTAIGENDVDESDGTIDDALMDVFEWMEQDHGTITGAQTGYAELDNMLNGLQKQDLIILGARPSMGKTAFAANICLNYATKYNGPAAIFSLEMSKEQLIKRMISSVGNIDASKMRNPKAYFVEDDWRKSVDTIGELGNMPFHIFDDPGVDVNYIRKKCRMLKKKYEEKHIVVMIDYLQLVLGDPKHKGNRTAEISEISRTLKHIARDLDITIIALSQLSRAVEQRQDKRPMLSDLRESGQIEQDADVIGFLYRDDYYNAESEKKNIIEIIIAKQRNGPTGKVELVFLKNYSKFINVAKV